MKNITSPTPMHNLSPNPNPLRVTRYPTHCDLLLLCVKIKVPSWICGNLQFDVVVVRTGTGHNLLCSKLTTLKVSLRTNIYVECLVLVLPQWGTR